MSEFNQELLTEDVQEIIGYRPHWMVRKGNLLFGLILLGILSLTYIIRYPDMIASTAKLLAEDPPRQLNARVSGKIQRLMVENNNMVIAGQHIALLENTASYEEVLQLRNWLNELKQSTHQDSMILLSGFPEFKQLGELQPAYQQAYNQWMFTTQTVEKGFYVRKRSALMNDLSYLTALKDNTNKQIIMQQQDNDLMQKELQVYEKLAEEKVIAPIELNQYKSKMLAKQQVLQQMNSLITNNEFNIHNKKKELLEIEKQIADQQLFFQSEMLKLSSEVEAWIQKYVISASVDGQLQYVTTLNSNVLINSGQVLFNIQPLSTDYYTEIIAAQRGIGKVKPGQTVQLKVEGYPSEEFGRLYARVDYVAGIPNQQDSFLIKASLPNGLVTNYKKNIIFKNQLKAEALIVTDNRRLLYRLLGDINTLFVR